MKKENIFHLLFYVLHCSNNGFLNLNPCDQLVSFAGPFYVEHDSSQNSERCSFQRNGGDFVQTQATVVASASKSRLRLS